MSIRPGYNDHSSGIENLSGRDFHTGFDPIDKSIGDQDVGYPIEISGGVQDPSAADEGGVHDV